MPTSLGDLRDNLHAAPAILDWRSKEGRMSKFLLIESRDPFESNDVSYYYDLASNLVANGHEVTLYLVQNGVLAARRSAQVANLSAVASAGVTVVADEFSLRERGITAARLARGVSEAPIDVVVDHLAEGARTLWH
jgi:sulfur relay (sulfurtransferase) complex TusBCD TusD component (DsrE family)